jgi:hypothetical protein
MNKFYVLFFLFLYLFFKNPLHKVESGPGSKAIPPSIMAFNGGITGYKVFHHPPMNRPEGIIPVIGRISKGIFGYLAVRYITWDN